MDLANMKVKRMKVVALIWQIYHNEH